MSRATRGVTGAVLVEVRPVGLPGVVELTITDAGNEPLTRAEAVALLQMAATDVETSEVWPTSLPGVPGPDDWCGQLDGACMGCSDSAACGELAARATGEALDG